MTFVTKHAIKVERAESLRLHPPLELRAGDYYHCVEMMDEADAEKQRIVSPISAAELNAELVRRFEKNPYDRIVMACYHFFRSQFDNEFMSPTDQDYASYCASLEASLEVDSQIRGVCKRITKQLIALYPGLDGLDSWMRGLYGVRSIFVHGVSQEEQEQDEDISRFRKRKDNHRRLQCLCLDVIHESLRESLGRRLRGENYLDLRKLFSSDKLWASIRHEFRPPVATILGYSSVEQNALIQVCRDFADAHDWRCMAGEEAKVFKVLVAIAHTISKSPGISKTDKTSASSLFRAADATDSDQVRSWLQQHYCTAWNHSGADDDLLTHLKRAAYHAAAFFEPIAQD